MSVEVDQLWRLVGPDTEKLRLTEVDVEQFRRNDAYAAVMGHNLRAYFLHVVNERWPHYYESLAGRQHPRSEIRAIVAPYCYFLDDGMEDPGQREHLVRSIVTRETYDKRGKPLLDCSDFVVDTKRNAISVRKGFYSPTPPTQQYPMGYWPMGSGHVPKVFSTIQQDETAVTVSIYTGVAYERGVPLVNDFQKVRAAQRFLHYAAHLSLGNELQLARDVIFRPQA